MNLTLQFKILLGYLLIVIFVGSIAYIMLYERSQIDRIELQPFRIEQIRRNMQQVYNGVIEMSSYGEFVADWNSYDRNNYHMNRLRMDKLLLDLHKSCPEALRRDQIDTLRFLLQRKEERLYEIQEIFIQDNNDSVLLKRLPQVARNATQIREITRKKSGLAGLLGGKKTVYVTPSAKELNTLSERLITSQYKKINSLNRHLDSLRIQNKMLIDKIHLIVNQIDCYVEEISMQKRQKLIDTLNLSYNQVAAIIVLLTILLILSYVIIHKDILKKEKGRRKLQRINDENIRLLKMSKKIILTVSHDIRGPLGNIMGSVELAMETREKKKRNYYLNNVLYLGRRISHLVNDLMDVYRINEAKDVLNEIPFHLSRLLERVADNYRMKANSNGLIFESVHHYSDVTVKGDGDKFAQILDNLLTNAIKFTPAGSVHFLSEYSNDLLHVEIRDTGIGMTREVQEHIFDPFERAAQEINAEGFGLGLYITDGLVRALKGSIDIESEVGKGSIFRLDIPFPETVEMADAEVMVQEKAFILPENILVVDDDPILLKIVDDILTRYGVACTACSNTKDAVKNLQLRTYDLLITDIQMPQTDGFGLLKLLRSSDIGNSRTVPVAAMTARGDSNAEGYFQAGFCGCIHKPFSKADFLTFISSITNKDVMVSSAHFDFSRLMEDAKDVPDMFALLIKESYRNLTDLKIASKDGNHEQLRVVVHRMFPVWELLGVSDILHDFRKILISGNAPMDKVKEMTGNVIAKLKELIKEAEKQQEYNTAYEKKNTDN